MVSAQLSSHQMHSQQQNQLQKTQNNKPTEEQEQIIANLRSQNSFLRGEIEILRRADADRLKELDDYKDEVEGKVGEMKMGFKSEINR